MVNRTSVPEYRDPDGIFVSRSPAGDTLPRPLQRNMAPRMPPGFPHGESDHLVAAFVIGADGRAEVGTVAILEEPKHQGVIRSVCEFLKRMTFIPAHPEGAPARSLVVMPFHFRVGEVQNWAQPNMARANQLVFTTPRAELFPMLAEYRGCPRAT